VITPIPRLPIFDHIKFGLPLVLNHLKLMPSGALKCFSGAFNLTWFAFKADGNRSRFSNIGVKFNPFYLFLSLNHFPPLVLLS